MNLPDGNSLDLLASSRRENPDGGEWILLTAYGSIPYSVHALQLGAHDFLERPVDVRLFAATNLDLESEVANDRFRSDLYHRLSVFQITLPGLAQRTEDIEELVPPFVAEFCERSNKHIAHTPDDLWQTLRDYPWPGNIRGLRNVIEHCVLLSPNGPIRLADTLGDPTQGSGSGRRDEMTKRTWTGFLLGIGLAAKGNESPFILRCFTGSAATRCTRRGP